MSRLILSVDSETFLPPPETVQALAEEIATVPGVKGDPGAPGEPGHSAYMIAQQNGFVGTELEWLASLVSTEPGPPGIGEPGEQGASGMPYYPAFLSVPGPATEHESIIPIYFGHAGWIRKIAVGLGSAPTGGPFVIDILADGSSILGGTAITIASFDSVAIRNLARTTLPWASFTKFTIRITSVGTIAPGSDVVVALYLEPSS